MKTSARLRKHGGMQMLAAKREACGRLAARMIERLDRRVMQGHRLTSKEQQDLTLARYMIDFMVGNALRVPSAADQIALFGDVVKVTVEKVT